MLDALRRGAGTWVAKIFIGLLVLSFAVWGIADIFSGRQGTALATVGEVEISEVEYRDVFQREIQQLSQRLQQQLSVEQARQLGVDRQVLQRLISQAALDSRIQSFKLAVPDQAIADRIIKDRVFQDSQGRFDRGRFELLLANNGFTEEVYIATERRNILRAELAGIVDQAVDIPDTMVKAIHKQQNETRETRYFVLPAAAAGELAAPSDEELKSYYDANKRRFTAPEFRTLTLLRLEPSDLVSTISVSDEELRKVYEDRSVDFVTPERREVDQITFPDEEQAKAARARIESGTDFLEIAKERGLKQVDYALGTVTQKDILDAEIGKAAFALPDGTVSQPVKGSLATVILRAKVVTPEQRRSFDDVKTELKNSIALERAQEEVINIHDTVEDARAGGSTLVEISTQLNLPLIKIDAVDRSGMDEDGKAIETIPSSAEVLNLAFESDVGVENDPVDTQNNGYVWVDVDVITPEALRPLEDVKAEASDLWTKEKLREKLFERAQALVEKGRQGTSLDELAKSTGQTVQQSKPMRRRDASGDFSATALANIFRQAQNGLTLAPKADGDGFLIMQVAKITVPEYKPDQPEARSLTTQLKRGLGEDLLQQYLNGLQEDLGVSVNSNVWNSLRGGSY